MIERLDQLMLKDFIEMSCGNPKVLLEKHEVADDKKLLKVASELIDEYKSIATPTKAKVDLIDAEDGQKLLMKEKCARILVMLCKQGHHNMTLEVLEELEIDTDKLTTPELIENRCESLLNEAKYDLERFNEQQKGKEKGGVPDEKKVRNSWSREIASVMATLRMSIDPATTSAAIYANLVRQAAERVKAMSKVPAMMQF